LASDTSGETSNTSAKTQISVEQENSIGLTKIIEGINLSDTKNSTKREPVSTEDICPVREVPIFEPKIEPKLEPGELEPTPERPQHPGDILFRAEIEDRPTTPVSSRDIRPIANRADFSFPSQPNMSMSDSVFMNDSAALKQLEDDEADFEESNRFKLDKSEFSTVNDESMMDRSNGTDVSAFFRRSSASLGIGMTDSPKKDLRNAQVPIEYGGASETFDILPEVESERTKTNEMTSEDDRRDTVATINPMSTTFFEPTQTNWKKFHEDLKAAGADESTISSFCLKNIENEHAKVRKMTTNDTFDMTIEDHHGSNRYSTSTVDWMDPKRASSPDSKSSCNTSDLLIDSPEETRCRLDELCKTKNYKFEPIPNSEIDETKIEDENPKLRKLQSREKHLSISGSNSGLGGGPSGGTPSVISGYSNSFGCPHPPPPSSGSPSGTCGYPNSYQSHSFQPIHIPHQPMSTNHVGHMGGHMPGRAPSMQFQEPIRCFSPVPLIDFPSLIDFREPIFVGSHATNPLPIRMTTNAAPWVQCSFNFREMKTDKGPVEKVPFILNEKMIELRPGQTTELQIKFQPSTGGNFTGTLEILLNFSDQYNRPVSQSHTVNIIGISIEPIIRIGAKDSSDYIEVNGKTIVPIQNESNFDIPVCIEIDSGFTLTVENQITNRILIPKNGQIRCVVATYPIADQNETIGKLKVLHDLDSGKHKTYQERRILKWAVLKRQNGDLELAGPTKDIVLSGVVHKTKSVQVPITNLNSSYAQVNANITGDCADMMQLTPETASIGPDGQLVFTIKYTASTPHVPRLHNLVIEVSGQQREFVFPFKISASRQQNVRNASISGRPSLESHRPDQILSNKKFLIFAMVEKTEPEMKPITLRGSGTYIVTLSGDSECFQVYEGNEDISNLKIKLTAGKDLVLGVKFKPKENGKIYSAILTLASTTNKPLLNNLSLVGQSGKAEIKMNEKSDSKMKLSSGIVELSNVGGCNAFVFMFLPDKQVQSLKIGPGEVQTVAVDSGETTIYHGSEDLRKILAQAVLTPSGKAEQTAFLKKLKSSKLIKINFGCAPASNLRKEIVQYEKEIIGVFFRTLTLRHTYDYDVTSITQMKSSPQDSSSLGIRSRAKIQVLSSCRFSLQLDNVKIEGNDQTEVDAALSTRNIDFGTIAPKSTLTQTVQIANNEKEAQAWIIHAKPGQKMDKEKFNPFIISKHEGTILPGEKMGIDVRFNPRREGSYNLELMLEYHIKSLMGLAKTIKKETLALNGIAKGTENSLRLDSNFIVFEKEELQKETALSADRLIMKKIRMKNHSKEYLNITISSPEQPFSLGKQNEIKIKPRFFIDFPIYLNLGMLKETASSRVVINANSDSGTICEREELTISASLL
jgi:hypothetical protein